MSDWLTWQVIDSAFPTGMFAHSFGLESAWQQGDVDGPESLDRFLRASVLQAGYATLPLLNSAYHCAYHGAHRSAHPSAFRQSIDPQTDNLAALDELCEVFLVNPVANRASRVQGRALMATSARVWPSETMAALGALVGTTRAHAAPVSGAVFQTLGLPLATAQRIVLLGAARGVLAAAVRLGIAGSFEAQRLQHGCAGWLDEVATRCADLTADDLAQTAPIIDILQAGHDRLYSRLFQS